MKNRYVLFRLPLNTKGLAASVAGCLRLRLGNIGQGVAIAALDKAPIILPTSGDCLQVLVAQLDALVLENFECLKRRQVDQIFANLRGKLFLIHRATPIYSAIPCRQDYLSPSYPYS